MGRYAHQDNYEHSNLMCSINKKNTHQVSTMCLANVQGNRITGMNKKHQSPTLLGSLYLRAGRVGVCEHIHVYIQVVIWTMKKTRQNKADREVEGKNSILAIK